MSADRSLYQTLREYAAGDVYPCHMPGHKRNPAGGQMAAFFDIDITEIEGFDNLHHAEGVLREAQERANRFYGADQTFFLVNGSTAGILAAVMAAVRPGEEILIARNCHRSVYHAALMQNLKVHYYQPRLIREYDICDGVSAAEIGKFLDDHSEIRAVVITSPTYEGILSDVAGVAAAVHERGRILIVDEAHGAHLGIVNPLGINDKRIENDSLPEGMYGGAVAAGADLVIHSLHKTLPSLTQTALLHVNGSRVDRNRLCSYLAMVQSSSPSYVFMAGIDACIRFLEKDGQSRLAFFSEQWREFFKKTSNLKHISIGKMTGLSEKGYALAGWDKGKILISVKDADMTGKQLADELRESFHIELEMAADAYALALMTLMDKAEGWQRLADALCEIDDRIEKERRGDGLRRESKSADDGLAQKMTGAAATGLPEAVMTLAQAFHSGHEEILPREASGRISAGFIYLYPPGIPLVVPGERLTQRLLDVIAQNLKKGLTVQGISSAGRISVVVEIP